jgi:hypothetical protein
VEGMLATAIKCDQLCHDAHVLRLEIEVCFPTGGWHLVSSTCLDAWFTDVEVLARTPVRCVLVTIEPSDACSQSKRESDVLALPVVWDEDIVLDIDATSRF